MRNAILILVCTAAAGLAQVPYFGGSPQGMQGLHRSDADRGLMTFTPFLTAGWTYSTGLGRFNLLPDGTIPNISSSSVYGAAGVTGSHAWRRSLIGVSYSGSYSQTFTEGNLSGLTQRLGVAYTKEFGRNTEVMVTAQGSMSNRAFGNIGGAGLGALNTTGLVYSDPFTNFDMQNEILDGRSYMMGVSIAMSHRIGRNWEVMFGGTAVDSFRNVKGLPGTVGNAAQGAVARRLNRRMHLNLAYSYSQYRYSKGFGDSNANQGTAGLSFSLDEKSSLSFSGGIVRVERIALTQVKLAPELAAILGTSVGQEVFYGDNKYGAAYATYARTLRRANVNVSYSLSVVPGNGFYVTSRSHMLTGTYNRTAFRHLSVGINGGMTRQAALMQDLKPQQTWFVAGNVGRQFGNLLNISGSGGFRRIQSGNAGFSRDTAYVSVSLTLSPHSVHVPAWW